MDRLEKKVLHVIRKEALIPPGSSVVCGFSGGADSLCLLCVLVSLKRMLKADILALHVNHGLRGEEADRDEAFCRSFCRERGIAFQACSVDVRALAEREKCSTEEAARVLRYQALQEAAGPQGLIAVAHHADDQAETILLNLLRGSGLKGLAGMQPKRDRVIRPLLGTDREEILSYLDRKKLSYVTDSSNLSDDYTRNRIRHGVLPAMKQINPQACLHLLKTGQMAGQAEEFLEEQAEKWFSGHAFSGENEIRLKRKILKEQPQILRRYVIIASLRHLGINLKDWGEVHIAALDEGLGLPKGSHLDLPQGAAADNTGQELILRKAPPKGKQPENSAE